MKKMIFPLLLIAAGLFSCESEKRSSQLQQTIAQKNDSIQLLQRRNDTLKKQIDSLVYETTKWFDENEIDFFKEKGIADPEGFLTDDLMSKPQLIPYKGVLGGTMRTWDVTLLGDHWAIAYIEDGHVAGRMLLKYSVTKDKQVKWVVMDAYME